MSQFITTEVLIASTACLFIGVLLGIFIMSLLFMSRNDSLMDQLENAHAALMKIEREVSDVRDAPWNQRHSMYAETIQNVRDICVRHSTNG